MFAPSDEAFKAVLSCHILSDQSSVAGFKPGNVKTLQGANVVPAKAE